MSNIMCLEQTVSEVQGTIYIVYIKSINIIIDSIIQQFLWGLQTHTVKERTWLKGNNSSRCLQSLNAIISIWFMPMLESINYVHKPCMTKIM